MEVIIMWREIIKQPRLGQLPKTYAFEAIDEEGAKPDTEPEGYCNRKLKAYADNQSNLSSEALRQKLAKEIVNGTT